jgi:hypothetical protein
LFLGRFACLLAGKEREGKGGWLGRSMGDLSVKWLVGWLVGWPVAYVGDCLAGWFVGWLDNLLVWWVGDEVIG